MRSGMRATCLAIILVAGGGGSNWGRGDRPATADELAGCIINDDSPGDHEFTCEGLKVAARIPPKCEAGCGLILLLHGDTGNGVLMDDHVKLRDLGAAKQYFVVAPTGPGSTWHQSNDETLVKIVNEFKNKFRVDPKKIHVTGFSRGGYVTWRLLCDHADLFASAAPAAAGYGDAFPQPETTCFQNGRAPTRKIPILFLMGRHDPKAFPEKMDAILHGAITDYGATTPPTLLDSDANYRHRRWTGRGGATIETFDHAYTTAGELEGHCIVGSKVESTDTQLRACKRPTAFVWGQQIMQFFIAHPKP